MLKKNINAMINAMIILLLLFGISVMGIAQEDDPSIVTLWVLEDFDNHELSSNVNVYNGGRHQIEWDIVGSTYTTRTDEKPYPQRAFVKGYPGILPKEYRREAEAMQILAVRSAFNSKGINKLELYPTDTTSSIIQNDNTRHTSGVFFDERVEQIGIYVLGILRSYDIYAVFSTVDGETFSVYLGDTNYTGWKPLIGDVYRTKPIDEKKYINDSYLVKLEKLVVETRPGENVNDFVLYMDHLFYSLKSVNSQYYDGAKLIDPDFKYNYVLEEEGKNNVEWEAGSTNSDADDTTTNN